MLQPELEIDECWSLLEEQTFGRLTACTATGADIFPINFTVHERAIYFRSAPRSKLVDLTRRPLVAFEVDGRGPGTRWSVVIKGEAQRLNSDAEIEASGVLALHTATPVAKLNYVRIMPSAVTGQQFGLLEVLSGP